MWSTCDFVSKFDAKLKNVNFSASLRLCGEKATFFRRVIYFARENS